MLLLVLCSVHTLTVLHWSGSGSNLAIYWFLLQPGKILAPAPARQDTGSGSNYSIGKILVPAPAPARQDTGSGYGSS